MLTKQSTGKVKEIPKKLLVIRKQLTERSFKSEGILLLLLYHHHHHLYAGYLYLYS